MSRLHWRGLTAALACLLILVLINLAIADKEHLLQHGRVVYLELAPVDPRSLMQGDYMALNYTVARAAEQAVLASGGGGSPLSELSAHDGRIVVGLDERSVAAFDRIEDEQPLMEGEVLMRYRMRNGRVRFATNAFFFQEGTGEQYREARYGRFRVNPQGELLLTGLCDENLRVLGSSP